MTAVQMETNVQSYHCSTNIPVIDGAVPEAIPSDLSLFPRDILLEIFIWLSWSADNHADINQAPWVLGHVCRSWRDIIKSVKWLWSMVILSVHSYDRRVLCVLKHFLRRSDQSLFKIDLTFDEKASGKAIRSVFRVLFPHFPRCAGLSILIPQKGIWELLDLAQNLPELRFLDIFVPSSDDEDDFEEEDTFSIFHSAPKLTGVSLFGLYTVANISLPASQLREFHGDFYTAEELHQFLSKARHLDTLEVSFHDPASDPLAQPLIHNNLRQLVVLQAEFAWMETFSFPSLEELEIFQPCTDFQFAGASVHELSALVERSMCKLHKFALRAVFPASTLIHILWPQSSLTELQITVNLANARVMFIALTASDFLPMLMRLEMTEQYQSSQTFSVFMEIHNEIFAMIRSRWVKEPDSRLRYLCLEISNAGVKAVRKMVDFYSFGAIISEARVRGLDIHLNYLGVCILDGQSQQ
ncbi:uncharacterized protein BT62DRAFT_1077559 [Guyanagaster necrorhizus]|uniref:F-box domain-containing protein n=1 Tax=Guyanagaster necrorhizus TaxID=856835 RepID=A0A9P7VRT8_9AGAR|nr:uncharacterized protein BT62DRAFT_1077559 [Guyanagaster necrorhizus MCA 3950]KAG7444806.1 hypothetical protein BT62DRAFT_1077559 [Guyanagaster necrorhizus MCA 3950]